MYKTLPSGWDYYWQEFDDEPLKRRIYRNIETRKEQEAHPNPQVEHMLEMARNQLKPFLGRYVPSVEGWRMEVEGLTCTFWCPGIVPFSDRNLAYPTPFRHRLRL